MTDTELIEAIGKYDISLMMRPDRITASWVICYDRVREHRNFGLPRNCNDAVTIREVIEHAVKQKANDRTQNFMKE